MNRRLKLLLIFSGVSLVSLVFFGFVAYDTARSASINKEQEFLQQFLDTELALIEREFADHGDLPAYAIDADLNQKMGLYLALFNDKGVQITPKLKNADVNAIVSHVSNLIWNSARAESGQVARDGIMYSWFVRPFSGLPFTAVLVYESHQAEAFSFFQQMGIPLIFTLFIVLWLSSWCAMYVAGLLDRLNEQKEHLQHSATHDILTKLPNRALMIERLDEAIAFAQQHNTSFALCFIDLNRFKEVNDTLGHQYGDELLVHVSKRLRDAMRGSDTVARLGGDEFAIVMQEIDTANVDLVCQRIVLSIEKAIELNRQSVFVSASVGIAMFPVHGLDAHTLIRHADVAMYAAKRSGNRIAFYADGMENIDAKLHLSLGSELRDALKKGEMKLFYQPKFDLFGKTLLGAEALIRWQHPQRGLLSPAEFIDLAEKTGLIKPLTSWVIDRAFFDYTVAKQMGFALQISINLSMLNLYDDAFVDDVKDSMERYFIEPKHFVFELTESAVMDDPAKTKVTLDQLSELGFLVSVDDFGTGYSSFVNLKRLPIDEIKIDRSFVMNMIHNEDDESIVRATIQLGKSLGINVVAEGVENQETFERIQGMGCDTVQGYLIGKPMPLDQLLRHIVTVDQGREVRVSAGT